jgi:hypothetical protein
MNKNTILELSIYTEKKIIDFSEYYNNENVSETSFSDWNVRDVIGHINSWILFSKEKMEFMESRRSLNADFNVDIVDFNKKNYEENKNKPLKSILHETKIIFIEYRQTVFTFGEQELWGEKFPTDLEFKLFWELIGKDTFIHPIMHILYQYLKRKDYNEFIKEIESSKEYFMEYSRNSIDVYFFADLFDDTVKKEKRFEELKEFGNGNEMIEKIIKRNMK